MLLVALMGFGAFAVPAKAQITFLYTVKNTSDTVVANACANATAGCSLRGAIQAANASGASTIAFAIPANDPFCTGGVCTINLGSALPDITVNTEFDGPGADKLTVRRNAGTEFRIFNVTTAGTVFLFGMTISNGSVSLSMERGGGVQNASTGTVSITNCVLSGNFAFFGGGIENASSGTMSITNCVLSGNVAFKGGGIDNTGGGTVNSGTMNVAHTTLTGNSAPSAGGIYNSGILNVTDSTLTGNSASAGDGGGISNFSNGPITGTANITNCTLSNNSATAAGGGISNASAGRVNVTNSTLSGNSVLGPVASFGNGQEADGGGIATGNGDTVTITNCTFAGNSAVGGTGASNSQGGNGEGGGIYSDGATVTIINSTFLGNSATGGAGGPSSGAGGAGEGGGIRNKTGTISISNSTFSGNSVTGGVTAPSGFGPGVGGGINSSGVTQLKSTIIARSTASASGPDVNGSFTSQGFNLIGKNDGAAASFPTGNPNGSGDIVGTAASPIDPKFDPAGLQNNGGPTSTTALLFGSPAIDKGINTVLATVTSAINNSTTAINVNNASNIPAGAGYTILIDSEQMVVTSKAGNSLTVTRGANSTMAASHSTGASLYPAFDQRGTGFPRTFNDPAIPNANGGDNTDIGAFEVQVVAPPPTPTPTPTPTATPTATPTTLANISTRLPVQTGDNVLIGGFIVTGTQDKKVIIRALGPSVPVPGALANPTLELYSGSTLLESNDNWVDSPNKQAIIDSTIPPPNNLESAIVRTLPANSSAYTAIVRGVNNTTGIAVVEAYDLDRTVNSKLANISTRGLVQTGDNVLIAGTIILGQASQKVIIRAIGPSLSVPGKLADPTLELRDQNGGLLEANDNWVDSPNKQAIIDSTIPPSNNLESAIVRTLPANGASYTAILRGVNNTTGIAVVEIYALQ